MSKIDIVVTWVDGTDPVWLSEKALYTPESIDYKGSDSDIRYRSSELFRFWFRGIEKYASWVNQVFFVTYGHVPEWLNADHPKLKIVKHSDYIPKEYLPTYNSNVIELNLHRIPELSEHFVLFNDDIFLIDHVTENDFFVGDKVKIPAVYRPIIPLEEYDHTSLNNVILTNKYFANRSYMKKNWLKFFNIANGKYNIHNVLSLFYSEIIGYRDFHVTVPHLKSTLDLLWKKESELLHKVNKQKFRSAESISHLVLSHWNIEMGKFEPQHPLFGRFFELDDVVSIQQAVRQQKYKVICINDVESDKIDTIMANLWRDFEKILPQKSAFEK